MSRIGVRFRSHLLPVMLNLLLLVGILGVFLPQQPAVQAKAALPAASATNVPVLLLHGMEGFNSANCNDSSKNYDRWGAFYQVNAANFAGLSFGLIQSLGYYSGDTCDAYLGIPQNDGTYADYPACQNYYAGNPGTMGTNSEDIRHIACRFYWYVWNNYTSQGKPVNILAHSMGGIIAKWALSEAAEHNSTQFPFPLLVYNVVTLSTPFQGVPDNIYGQIQQVSANLACGGCYEAQQLEVGPNSPNSIIAQLNNFSSTEGYWTVIGSYGSLPGASVLLGSIPVVGPILATLFGAVCDLVNISATTHASDSVVSPGPSLASAQVIYYDSCIFHELPQPGQWDIGNNNTVPLPGAPVIKMTPPPT